MSATDEQALDFVVRHLHTRPLRISMSPAIEERLIAAMGRFNVDDSCVADRDGHPADPLNVGHDSDLAVMALAMIDRGLQEDERDAGVWADGMGRLSSLPRPVRMTRRARLRWAWREARKVWRSL